MAAGCLDESAVIAFLDGTMSGAARGEVEAHLPSCHACADLVVWAGAELANRSRAAGSEGASAAGPLAPGSQVGRYQILGSVGRGAMGEVYAAYHPDLDRRIALKVVNETHADRVERRARLLREARTIARLSHPNVIAVYDAGTYGDRVYIAMEFVDGQTVDQWLASPRSWREILDVFLAAGRGLAAAHAASVVHRDFKPDNVMIGRNGSVRVMDFGLARLAHEGVGEGAEETDGKSAGAADLSPATVTKTGAVVGTPAYMAPEQFRGKRGDAQSDQFSFCVALHEALNGERPFAGDDVLTLSRNVVEEQVRPPPKDRTVPSWIRRVILRGLKLDPAQRWRSMADLIAELENDPAVRLRRRLLVGGAVALVAATLLVARQMVTGRRSEANREIAQRVEQGRRAEAAARQKSERARELRRRAFGAFDAFDRQEGESLWRQTRALVPAIDAGYDEAARGLEAAFTLDPSRGEIRAALADVRYEHLLFAEDFRLEAKAQVLEERLAAVDADGSRRRALAAPGSFTLRTRPDASRAMLERYERDPVTGLRVAKVVGPVGAAQSTTTLAPGSYRLLLDGPGFAQVAYPFELRRGERAVAELDLSSASAVPDGFAYVPPGEFWFGDADEQLRTQFLGTVPIHRRRTEAFVIAKMETTYRDWITFLESLPLPERGTKDAGCFDRRSRLPSPGTEGGTWQLTFQPSTRRYAARLGDPIVYEGRQQRISQDWSRFPVTGVSPDDVDRYLGWLRTSGRLPGARLCTEVEWERAARGADERVFPHGDGLDPQDANFDLTYGRVASAYGLDVVASHAASRSPFGIDDMVGNAFEFVVSSEEPQQLVIRGGAYYFSAASCRSTNREPVPAPFRDVVTGIRVCASTRR